MAENEERWAIKVHGIQMPGFLTKEEAQTVIDEDKSFEGTDAIPVKLTGRILTATHLLSKRPKGA